MLGLGVPVASSVSAFLTTIHLGLVVLRKYRSPAGWFPLAIIPSLGFTATPWIFATPIGLATGVVVHAAWFLACEWLIPVPASNPAPAMVAVPPPSPPPAPRVSPQAIPKVASPSKEFVTVHVLAVHEETETIRTFRLARPEGFHFSAGQFVTVRVQIDSKPHVRCYSISSAPETTGYMEISVRRQGLVSGTLHSLVRAGSSVMAKPPAGKFVYPANDDRPIVLVAGGVGVTPLMSMLRHGVAAEPSRPLTLIYSVRDEGDIAFHDELAVLTRRHRHVRVAVTVTGPAGSPTHRTGRITERAIRELVPDAAHSIFLLCGPLPMIQAVKKMAAALGAAPGQIRSEVFQAAAAIGAKASPAEDASDVAPPAARATHAHPHLTLTRSARTVAVPPQQTLLEAAERAGAVIPSLCRSGVCGTCRTRVLAGDVHCTSDAIDVNDRTAGYVLPCVSWARSDCTLDA